MSLQYKLVNKQAVPCALEEALEQYKSEERFIEKTYVKDILISTVFLIFNHGSDKHPILFETMVFYVNDYYNDIVCERCSTYKEAVATHKDMVAKYKYLYGEKNDN